MTNREKYKEEILDIACTGELFCVDRTGKIVDCSSTPCDNCLFYDPKGENCCETKAEKWCNSEYEEHKVDWSKVEVDTPIFVRNSEYCEWVRAYFAKYEKGLIYTWEFGRTSWTQDGIINWNYAKLAESEE